MIPKSRLGDREAEETWRMKPGEAEMTAGPALGLTGLGDLHPGPCSKGSIPPNWGNRGAGTCDSDAV